MNDLKLHPKTEVDMAQLVAHKPHAILIIGSKGIGKKAVSKALAEQLLTIDNLDDYPYSLTIKPDKSISVDSVREMEHFLSLKVPNNKSPNRVVIIHEAERLTLEAQNALLKTLEEPPEATIILMTLSHANLLLPTLRSRAQKLNVTPPDETSLRDLYKDVDNDEFNQAYLISGGLPGLLHALLDNEDHPLKKATVDARLILSKNLYERSLMINELAKDNAKLMDILQIMEQMATVSLRKGSNSDRWQKVLSSAYDARASLARNAQTKLTLLKLMFSL